MIGDSPVSGLDSFLSTSDNGVQVSRASFRAIDATIDVR